MIIFFQILLYKENLQLLEKLNFEDDNTFLEPLLFTYFNSEKTKDFPKEILEEIMQGYLLVNESLKIKYAFGTHDLAYIPKKGYFDKKLNKIYDCYPINNTSIELIYISSFFIEKIFEIAFEDKIFKEVEMNVSLFNKFHKQIENALEIIEINREEKYKRNEGTRGLNEELETNYKENTNDYLRELNYGNIPLDEISKLLNNYGFTIKQFKKLITYIEEGNVNLFQILGKLKSSDKDIYSINVVLNNNYLTINQMLENLKLENKFSSFDISKLVSIVIKMIYSVIPHKVIPAIEFMIELDTLYKVHNQEALLSKSVINEAKTKRNLFYKKFIGEVDTDQNLNKIMTKLFEYGIPYFRVKNHLYEILDKVPNNFSIHDIKKIIFEDSNMADLRVYFE